MPVWVGVDASVTRDSTAIVACTWDNSAKRARLVLHRIFQPSPTARLDFEQTTEKTLLELRDRFQVRAVRFDPYQMQAVAQRLALSGLPMVEFAQSVPNLTEASSNLYELIKGRNLSVYADDEIRLAISRCVAIETSRGWRIAKEKTSHKIDVVVALAMAALGAIEQKPDPMEQMEAWYRSVAEGQRVKAEAWEQGKRPPPTWAEEIHARGRARAEKLLQEIREIQERPNRGRILPSVVNYVTRRPT